MQCSGSEVQFNRLKLNSLQHLDYLSSFATQMEQFTYDHYDNTIKSLNSIY